MVGEACLPSNAYYPRTPDYTLCSGAHVCWSEHSDSSFAYGFMSLDYGFGTMTATTYTISFSFKAHSSRNLQHFVLSRVYILVFPLCELPSGILHDDFRCFRFLTVPYHFFSCTAMPASDTSALRLVFAAFIFSLFYIIPFLPGHCSSVFLQYSSVS